MSWVELAKGLQFGSKRKIKHCGNDATAYISNSIAGVRLYCFRCKEQLFEYHSRMSAAEIIVRQKVESVSYDRGFPEGVLCSDITCPDAAKVWLLRAGITPEHSEKYGFIWSPELSRVCVAIDEESWIARAVDGRNPKYILSKGSSGKFWTNDRDQSRCSELVVVVEDVLSAIKISESGFVSMAVLGTTVSSLHANWLSKYSKVVGWFDGDKAGRRAQSRLLKSLGVFGVLPASIRTDEDPKYHSLSVIQEKIKEVTWQ